MQSPADRYLSRHLIDTKGKRRDTMTEGKPKREQERERERERKREQATKRGRERERREDVSKYGSSGELKK